MIRQALLTTFGGNDRALRTNLGGVSHAESLEPPPRGGNPINWVVGHVLSTRGGLLVPLVGASPNDPPFTTSYGRGSDPRRSDWRPLPLEELLARFADSQARLVKALETTPEATFERMVPKVFEREKQEPLGVQLAFASFHESYHVGQVGLLRRMLGKAGAIA